MKYRIVSYNTLDIATIEEVLKSKNGKTIRSKRYMVDYRMIAKPQNYTGDEIHFHPLEWFNILGLKGDMLDKARSIYLETGIVIFLFAVRGTSRNYTEFILNNNDNEEIKIIYSTSPPVAIGMLYGELCSG
jgi:hypothetical protein